MQLYAREICRYLQQTRERQFILIAPGGTALPSDLKHLDFITIGKTKGYAWEQIELPAYLKKRNEPLLINFCNTAPLLYKNQIVTIHDLAFMHHPEWFSKSFARVYRFLIPRLAKRATRLITVSETIKSQIISRFQVSPDKVSVLYNGLQHDLLNTPASSIPKEKLVFTVSSVNPRKNLGTVIKAFKQANLPGYKLIISGAKNAVFAAENLPESDDHIIFAGYMDNQTLISHYKRAELFISLSLDEGFGIPVLEASRFGCKLLISDIPVYRELFGQIATFTNPLNINECAERLSTLSKNNIDNEEHTNELTKRYSYQQSALGFTQLVDGIF